jgi:large subunit ribosomal protein L19
MDLSTIAPITVNENVADMNPGDTVKVNARIKEGARVRTQTFQGVVIKKQGTLGSASFTVRRVAHGVGVERSYLIHSPLLESVEVVRRGAVRRAKLLYLRGRSAKDARIKEKGRPTRSTPSKG